MDGPHHPGRPDVKSAYKDAKSGQATNTIIPYEEIPSDVRRAANALALDIRHHVATSRRELIKHDPELCRMLEDAIMADRKKMASRRRRLSITPKQRDALNFIKAYYRESRGVCPSYTEIRDALGIASTSGVHRLVNGLERRGHIIREPGRARTIQVIE